MQIGHSEKLKLSPEQKSKLSNWIGSARVIWNSKIEENNYYYSFARKFVPINQWQWINKQEPEYQWINQQFSQFKNKDLTPWLSEVPSTILRNSATNWFQTQMKFMKGECGPPRKKSRSEGGSILLTNDTYEVLDFNGYKITLMIGQKKNNIGIVTVRFRRKIASLPNSITIKVDAYDRWKISFSYEDQTGQVSDAKSLQKEWLEHLKTKDIDELTVLVMGLDRGVKVPVATLDKNFDFTKEQKNSMSKKDRYLKKLQRKLSRQKKGSKKRNKTKSRISRLHTGVANIRKDFAHKLTHELTAINNKKVFVLENLSTKNMTKSASGTMENPGKNVAAKSGLNREILKVGWHQIETFLTYKAIKNGKIVFKVAPNHTSQECSHCGHTHADNRLEQSKFDCVQCGFTANADTNASQVIQKRAIKLILDSGTELSSKGVLQPKIALRQKVVTRSRTVKTGARKVKTSALVEATQEKRLAS